MKSNNMPISEVMDNLIISKDAKLSAVYKLDLPSKYETAKIEERETLSDRIKNFINSIDSNTYLQFYYDFQKKDNPKKYKKEDYGDKLINKVQHSRVDHLSNISHLDMKLFCTITISIKSHKQKSVFKNILFSGENKETTEREYQKAKNKLERSLRKFEDFINLQEKIDYKRLQNKEIRQLLIAHYNNYSYEHVKKNDIDIQDNYLDINKKLLRKDYIVEKSHLQIDEEKVKIIRIDDLFTATMPAIKNSDMYQYSISLLHSILYDLDFQHKTIINIQNVDKKDIVKKVKRNKRIDFD